MKPTFTLPRVRAGYKLNFATCNQTAYSQLFKGIYYAGLVTSVEVTSESELQEGVAYELKSNSFGATPV